MKMMKEKCVYTKIWKKLTQNVLDLMFKKRIIDKKLLKL